MMRDFLGNEYGEGDLVLYAASGHGSSISMIFGRVVSVSERYCTGYEYTDAGTKSIKSPLLDKAGDPVYSVRIQPMNSSRWEHHDQRTYYVDSRTGEKIDRNEHVKSWGHYTLDSTGEVVPSDACEYMRYVKTRQTGWLEDMVPEKNPAYIEPHLRTYHRTVYNDYVEERHEGAKPVTITVTENIVKWSGELPGE